MNTDTLSRSDPRLLDLEQRYAALNAFEHSNWATYSNQIDLPNFRGEHGYLSQLSYEMTADHYARTWDYAVNHGLRDLLEAFTEDGVFGAITFTAPDGSLYSRDSLDSAFEIGFLRSEMSILDLTVLDIGAGYGRFAHRLIQTLQDTRDVFCVDAVPLSTYLCQYYLAYRGLTEQAISVPLDELDKIPHCDLAVNCYSFGELTLSSIEFWLRFCAEREVSYFLLVPHDYGHTDGAFVSHEVDGSNIDYLPLFTKYGYRQAARRHKYEPKEISPSMVFGTEYILLEKVGQ